MVNAVYVWIHLPQHAEPVLCGHLQKTDHTYSFQYSTVYLCNPNAIAINPIELPLAAPPYVSVELPRSLRDASPDAWGRRVLLSSGLVQDENDELAFLLASGSDRIGSLDFQKVDSVYHVRNSDDTALTELLVSTDKVLTDQPLSVKIDTALIQSCAVGGARPKAVITVLQQPFIAKFSTDFDVYSYVKAEYIAMQLAAKAGLKVAPTQYVQCANRDILLVQRFDRVMVGDQWQRKSVISALTLLDLPEMHARYASYEDLASIMRQFFTDSDVELRELYSRIVFNVLTGNTDDHARNHAALWDGVTLTLSPAYDICPQGRTGFEASQAMLIHGTNRASTLETCLAAAPTFGLTTAQAVAIIQQQIQAILTYWEPLCTAVNLSEKDKDLLWGRQFLNPYAFSGDLPESITTLIPAYMDSGYGC